MTTVLKILLGASALGLLVSLVAPVALRFFATEVTFVSPAAPEEVAVNRELWTRGEPVAPIYGVPASETSVVLFADPAKLVRPSEDPSLRLYVVDKQKGENPLQLKSVGFFARFAALGSAVGILSAASGLAWRRRRAAKLAAAALM